MNGDLPDIVRDYRLKTWYDGNVTIHRHNDPDAPPLSPTRQERWKKVRTLGQGGQGSITLEECIDGSRYFTHRAVKKIRLQNGETKQRYQRELSTMVRFSHDKYSKYFVKSLGWFASSSKLYITMEYFPAGDLYNYVMKYQHLLEEDGREIASQLVSGLSLMHSEGYSHRDIKPQNILIYQHPNSNPSGAWWVKLADFGISKQLDPDTSLTTVAIGTAAYMAPELFQSGCSGVLTNDYRPADVWALGVTIFFILTKTFPFEGIASTMQYAKNHGKTFPNGPLDVHQISKDGQSFIRNLMRPRLEVRPQLEEAKAHTWIESLLPSAQAAGQHSRPSTISSKRSSFDNGTVLTTEISTLATKSDGGEFWPFENPEHQRSMHAKGIKTVTESATGRSRYETRPPFVAQDNAWSQLVTAVHDGDIKTVKTLLGSNSSPMPLSVRDEELSLVRLLSRSTTGTLNIKNRKVVTALACAARVGHVPLVKLLISAGADVSGMDECDCTPLQCAIENGQDIVAKLLLDAGVDIEVEGSDGLTPLSLAASLGQESIVKLLLERGANIEAKDNRGQTPLLWAIRRDHRGVAILLLGNSANIEAKDVDRWTPLRWAIHKDDPSLAMVLLDKGADIEAPESLDSQWRPLMYAAHSGKRDMVELLLNRGAELEARGQYRLTAFAAAAAQGRGSVMELLANNGAEIDTRDSGDGTPLKYAIWRKDRYTEDLLVKLGAQRSLF